MSDFHFSLSRRLEVDVSILFASMKEVVFYVRFEDSPRMDFCDRFKNP